MEFHDDDGDWVLAGAYDDDEIPDEAAWVVEEGGGEDDSTSDERRRSISGVFYRASASGCLAFVPFDPRRRAAAPNTGDESLAFLPPGLAVLASSNGLLCLGGPWSTYYVCNPVTGDCVCLPRPPIAHSRSSSSAALVFDPSAASYLLVCAIGTTKTKTYRFDVFSSAIGAWRSVDSDLRWSGKVVASSGVSAGGAACWRTDLGAVLGYDPDLAAARLIPPPEGLNAGRWQLGEAGGRLCCAVVKPESVEVHALVRSSSSSGDDDGWALIGAAGIVRVDEGEEEEWELGGAGEIACSEPPTPLRFQSGDPEAVLWYKGRILGVDVKRRTVREAWIHGGVDAAAGPEDDFVAHINTVAPVTSSSPSAHLPPRRRR